MKVRRRQILEAFQITDATFDDPHPNPTHVRGVVYDAVSRTVRVWGPNNLSWHIPIGYWLLVEPGQLVQFCSSENFERSYERVPESCAGLPDDFNVTGFTTIPRNLIERKP